MSTPYDDEPVADVDFTICPTCGEDLPHHLCDGRSTAEHEGLPA